ncbi:MAG: hypothetical protein KBE65_21630 [Phycisphaerae bacterium]|nr:hypothetical protein [Phycisphaerae bacterium]
MCRKVVHAVSLVVALGVIACPALGGILLVQDDFSGDSLDPNHWQVVCGPDVQVSQAGGQVVFNRPVTQLNYLATARQFDPAVTPLIITGSVTLGPDADMDVWTRASLVANTGGGPAHVLDSGIRVNFWADAVDQGWPPILDILEKTAGVWPWNSAISDGANIAGDDEAVDWTFVVTDDGTTITATFTQTSNPSNSLTLTGTSTTDFATDYIAITVTNGALNDVTIVTTPPDPLLTDTFDGEALDLGKWQTVNGADVNIVQADGQILFDRPVTQLNYLATARQYDPAVTPLVITGSVTLGPDADMDVWTRTDLVANTGGGPGHVLDSGVRINFWADAVDQGWPPNLDILTKTAGVWPWDSSISGGADILGDDEALDWSFVITDDGSTITATFTQTSDPNNTVTLTGTCTTDFAKDYVAITVTNGTLNDLTIATKPVNARVYDSFEADALDVGAWQVLNGPTADIIQAGGQVYFSRPSAELNYLATAEPFDPTVAPLVITGSVTLGPDGDMDVWTRATLAGNTGGGPGHVLDSGVRTNLWTDAVDQGWPPILATLEKTAGVWPWSNVSSGANIPGDDEVSDWTFVITDNGTAVTATFMQTGNPANILTSIGTCATDFTADYVAFTVVNGCLKDVAIFTGKP